MYTHFTFRLWLTFVILLLRIVNTNGPPPTGTNITNSPSYTILINENEYKNKTNNINGVDFGIIGRTTHHGIHSNDASDIQLFIKLKDKLFVKKEEEKKEELNVN